MMASFSAKYFFADPVGTDLHQQVLPHPCDIATSSEGKGHEPFSAMPSEGCLDDPSARRERIGGTRDL
jgi:hypothetical protein